MELVQITQFDQKIPNVVYTVLIRTVKSDVTPFQIESLVATIVSDSLM
jgi:hypothetical protein